MNWHSIVRAATVVFPLFIGPATFAGACQSVLGSELGAQDIPSQRVKVIISRCLDRDYSIVSGHTSDGRPVNGVTAMTWVPPTTEDYQEMASIGPDAIKPLSLLLDEDRGGFVQLLAVRFLIGIGGTPVFDPLVRATKSDKWQVVRFTAMEGLAVSPNATEATAIIKALQTDEDPFIAEKARQIVDSLTHAEGQKSTMRPSFERR